MPSVGKGLPVHVAVCGPRDYPGSCAAEAGVKTYCSSRSLKFLGVMKPMAWWCWRGLIGHHFLSSGGISMCIS